MLLGNPCAHNYKVCGTGGLNISWVVAEVKSSELDRLRILVSQRNGVTALRFHRFCSVHQEKGTKEGWFKTC